MWLATRNVPGGVAKWGAAQNVLVCGEVARGRRGVCWSEGNSGDEKTRDKKGV